MQGKKNYQEKLFVNFQLSDHVPADNFYRKLTELLDFSFLYKSTAEYYGSEGQKSIDPIVFMKLILVGYLENINSDRRIIAVSRLRMDILYFIGYDIDEELPWHSTLSRTRQLYGQDIFTELFKKVLKQCIDKGMISGRRQAVDGVFIKANASLDSLIEKDILADADTYREELLSNEEDTTTPIVKLEATLVREHNELKPKKNPSNKTHFSPTDPDAKMSIKPGKAAALNYLGQVSVDTASHMITHVQAFTADQRDCQCLPSVLTHLIQTLKENDLHLEELVADTGYSSGEALKALEENNITGYIPNRPQFNHEKEGFTFEPEGNYFVCQNGKRLIHRGLFLAGNYWNNEYRINKKECAGCPLKNQCRGSNKNGALIRETVDKPYYDRMHIRMQSRKAKILMKKRQSTVEPVIGTLVNYLGLKRVNTKGIQQVNKCITMAAIAYNLKKLIKHKSRLLNDKLSNIQVIINQPNKGLNWELYSLFITPKLKYKLY